MAAVINNAEWKNAEDVMRGATLRGTRYPVPEAVMCVQTLPLPDPNDFDAGLRHPGALFAAALLKDPMPETDPDFDHACSLFAAAILEEPD